MVLCYSSPKGQRPHKGDKVDNNDIYTKVYHLRTHTVCLTLHTGHMGLTVTHHKLPVTGEAADTRKHK